MKKRRLITFDWALKRLLRSKANFEILEGFLSELLKENIIFFDIGHGKDYVYKGNTRFIGIHKSDELELSEKQKELYCKEKICEIYPEYYIIKVNQFNDVAKDTLDEWIYFFKNEEIKDEFRAKGLKAAKKKLDIMKLPEKERQLYDEYVEDLRFQASMVESTYVVGKMDGMKEGVEKGMEIGKQEEKIKIAKGMLSKKISTDDIVEISGLPKKEIEKFIKTG